MVAATTVLLLFTSFAMNNLQNKENSSTNIYSDAENVRGDILDTKFSLKENEKEFINITNQELENSVNLENKLNEETNGKETSLVQPVEIVNVAMLDTKSSNEEKDDENVEKISNDQTITVKDKNQTKGFMKKTPVKLNMKQGVMLNQILSVFSLTNSKNLTCQQQSKEFQFALRTFEPWALKMFDSSSKLQSGVLAGNLMDYGSFKQCIEIYAATESGVIRGKHCLLKIQPTENIIRKILSYRNISATRFENIKDFLKGASLYWSICIPKSCSYRDVSEHFNKILPGLTEGLDLKISLDSLDCYTKEDETPLSNKEIIVAYGILIYLSIIVVCTVLDIYKGMNSGQLIKIFSMYSNLIYIFACKADSHGLSCLHGIRFLSVIFVVSGHKFVMSLFFPLVNTLDVLDWLTTYPSTLVTGSTVSVDSFFLLSGLLVSYHFFEHMSNGIKFNLPMFYIHRYLRVTPPFAVVILIVTIFGQRFGSGPLWKKVSTAIVKPCEYFWWAALTYMQCYTNPRFGCILQTWYLNLDMQYYFFSPVLLLTTWKWKAFGLSILTILTLTSVLINFYVAWSYEFPVTSLIDNNMPRSDYLIYYYILPHIRVSPYFIGIGLGYFLHKTKNVEKKTSIGALVLGWTASCTIFVAAILGNVRYQEADYVYEAFEASAFMAMSRFVWSLALAWLIWTCRDGYGGPVNAFLSAPIFQILGKITYAIFLVHMPIQFLGGGASKSPQYFSGFNLTHEAFGDLFAVLIIALFLTILVEFPIYRLSLLFFKPGRPKISPKRSQR